MYQNHKYEYAPLGKYKVNRTDNIVATHEKMFKQSDNNSQPVSPAISLSYFTRPNTTAQNQEHRQVSKKDRSEALALIEQKKLQLAKLMDFHKEREGADGFVGVMPAENEEDEEAEANGVMSEDGEIVKSMSEEELSQVYDT